MTGAAAVHPVLRAGIAGGGRMATVESSYPFGVGIRSHLQALRATTGVDLRALCDPDPAARERGYALDVPCVYTTASEMLAAERLDLLCVCSPGDTHAEILRLAAADGVSAVLLEKPVAENLEAALAAAEAATAAGTIVAVNYSRRYPPAMAALREWVASGGIGSLQRIQGLYTKGLLLNGSHLIDLARWFAGSVCGVRAVNRLRDDVNDPSLDVDLEFASGAVGHLHALDRNAFDHFEMDLVGTRGRLRLTSFGHEAEVWVAADSARHPGYRELVRYERRRGLLHDVTRHAVDDLVEALRQRRAPRCSLADGVAALAVVEAARRSAAGGLTVEGGDW